jgi:hypothetical protein
VTRDELLAKIDSFSCCSGAHELALRAVVELHKTYESKDYGLLCKYCYETPTYPCGTIQAIEKELG